MSVLLRVKKHVKTWVLLEAVMVVAVWRGQQHLDHLSGELK